MKWARVVDSVVDTIYLADPPMVEGPPITHETVELIDGELTQVTTVEATFVPAPDIEEVADDVFAGFVRQADGSFAASAEERALRDRAALERQADAILSARRAQEREDLLKTLKP